MASGNQDVAVTDALARALQAAPGDAQTIRAALLAMQRSGLAKNDIHVLIEIYRVRTEGSAAEGDTEDNALLALDMLTGRAGRWSLPWGNSEDAAVGVLRVLSNDDFRQCFVDAFSQSSLLPPRPSTSLPVQHTNALADESWRRLSDGRHKPSPSTVFRVPKVGVATRPAQLLDPIDRICYESLVRRIEHRVEAQLSPKLLYPRMRDHEYSYDSFASVPLDWTSDFVIVADVESYYEGVEHDRLADLLSQRFQLETPLVGAVQKFLDAVSGKLTGLPQGLAASRVFGAAYLTPVDDELERLDLTFVRYLDDYRIGANSYLEGRLIIRTMERTLGEIGLRLNPTKTRVLKRETYMARRDGLPRVLEKLRARLRDSVATALVDIDSSTVDSIFSDLVDDPKYDDSDDIEGGRLAASLPGGPMTDLLGAYSGHLVSLIDQLKSGDYLGDIRSIESSFRETLRVLTGERHYAGELDLALPVLLLPGLTPRIVKYLAALASTEPTYVLETIREAFQRILYSDWESAWLATVLVHPVLPWTQVTDELSVLVRDPKVQPLTKAFAIQAWLLRGGPDDSWVASASDVLPQTLKSEIVLLRYVMTTPGVERPELWAGELNEG